MHGRPKVPELSPPHPRTVEPWSAIQLLGRLGIHASGQTGTAIEAWELGADRHRFVCAPERDQTGQVHCGGGAVSKHENSYLRFPASCDERPHHLAEPGSSRTELAGAGDRPDCRRITSWKSWCFWPDGRARGHGATSGGKASAYAAASLKTFTCRVPLGGGAQCGPVLRDSRLKRP